MSVEELIDWQAREWLEPWGDDREDYRFATLSAIIVSAAGLRRSDGMPWLPSHFIEQYRNAWRLPNVEVKSETAPPSVTPPKPKPVVQQQTQKEMEDWIKLWIQGTNITFKEGRRG